MKSCPLCGHEMDDGATHCERDWTRLGMPPPPPEPAILPSEQPQPLPFLASADWGPGFSSRPLAVGDRYTLGLLVGLEGSQAGKALSVKPGTTVFGSSMGAHVFIPDPDVAPHHCEVRSDGSTWRIVSLAAENAFRVNGETRHAHTLSAGDRLHIGSEIFVFQTVGQVMLKAWDLARPNDAASESLDENTPVATPALDPHVDPLPGKLLDGTFEVYERVAEGGIVVIYRARDVHRDEPVALRVLGSHVSSDPSWAARFVNASAAFARLSHPVWVRCGEAVQSREGLLYQPIEMLEGNTLRALLIERGKLPAELALRVIEEVCGALAEAHSQGILHRQLKPEKIMLCDDAGQARVRLLGTTVPKLDDPYVPQTPHGIVYGTPCYMSPEQARGQLLDPRSDVYALGILLYELLSGKPPFDSLLPMEVVLRHLKEPPAPLVEVSDTVAQVVMKALAKDAKDRQGSARELGRECAAALRTMGAAQR